MKSSRAKVLHEALGAPLLEHVLRAVEPLSPKPITVVVGHEGDAVEAAFAIRGAQFVRQNPPLGTGHALQVARDRIAAFPERTVLVVNGDLPLLRPETLTSLMKVHRDSRADATLLTVILEEPGSYGRVLRGTDGQVRAIVEAKDASPEEKQVHEVNAGVYVFEVPALLGVLGGLQRENAQGEYYLTDAIGLLRSTGRSVHAFSCNDSREVIGVNTMEELAEVSRILQRRRTDALMAEGVIVEDPDSVRVGIDAIVQADATLRPYTFLEGRTFVAAGARIGPFARLLDATVGAGAQILDHCLLRECVVDAGAAVGPFAHIRPGSRVGAGARVGNFVELKKTDLGDGSKAPHLSYIGDATIGPGVNIGAGTITCNYDGHAKHETRIEAGAFVGSDTTLVAPVTVGEGAYVAAGSAITEDVPPHALAIGRSRQVNKENWAKERRRGEPGEPPREGR